MTYLTHNILDGYLFILHRINSLMFTYLIFPSNNSQSTLLFPVSEIALLLSCHPHLPQYPTLSHHQKPDVLLLALRGISLLVPVDTCSSLLAVARLSCENEFLPLTPPVFHAKNAKVDDKLLFHACGELLHKTYKVYAWLLSHRHNIAGVLLPTLWGHPSKDNGEIILLHSLPKIPQEIPTLLPNARSSTVHNHHKLLLAHPRIPMRHKLGKLQSVTSHPVPLLA